MTSRFVMQIAPSKKRTTSSYLRCGELYPCSSKQAVRDAGGSRTHFYRVAAGRLAIWLQRQVSSSGVEPDPRPSQSRVRSATPRGCNRTRADGWIRTSMRRFTGPLPFSIEPHRHEAGAQGFEPCRAALETGCSPRSTLLKGVRGESNQPPRPSQGRMPNHSQTQ